MLPPDSHLLVYGCFSKSELFHIKSGGLMEESVQPLCFGELVSVHTEERVFFKWVTGAAGTDIYHTWQHSIVYACVHVNHVLLFPPPLSLKYRQRNRERERKKRERMCVLPIIVSQTALTGHRCFSG